MTSFGAGDASKASNARNKSDSGGSTSRFSRGVKSLVRRVAVALSATMVIATISAFSGGVTANAATPPFNTTTPQPNPSLSSSSTPTQCGVLGGPNIAMVVDLSSSMEGAPLQTLKASASSYVDALAGTNANINFVTFSTVVPAGGTNGAAVGSPPTYPGNDKSATMISLSTPSGVAQAQSIIAGWIPTGMTNIRAGLDRVAYSMDDQNAPGILPDGVIFDFVVVITDGGTSTSPNRNVYGANYIKWFGTRIFIIQVGNPMTATERSDIEMMAGPNHNLPVVAENDYFEVGWDGLSPLLGAIADLCQSGAVHVRWVDDDNNGAEVAPAAGTQTDYAGAPGSPVGFTEQMARAGMPSGYEFNGLENVLTYDADVATVQPITVHMKHARTQGPDLIQTRTITYQGAPSNPAPVVQNVTWQVNTDQVTNTTTYTTSSTGFPAVTSPAVTGYAPDRAEVPVEPVVSPTTIAPTNLQETVTYSQSITDLNHQNSTFAVSITDASKTSVIANGVETWTGTLTARDDFNTLLDGLDTSKMTFGVPANVTVSNITAVGNGTGQYTVTYTSTKADSYPVTMTYNGTPVNGSPQTITFVHGPVDPNRSHVTVNPSSQTVGAPVTITVTVNDANDNPIPGLQASDFVVAGKSAGLPDLTLSNFQETAPGVYTYSATSKKVGEFEVTATVQGVLLADKPHVTFTPGEVCVTNCEGEASSIRMVDNDRMADGIQKDSAIAKAFDTYGNVVPNATVVVTDKSTGAAANTIKPSTNTATTGADGTAMLYWTSTVAGEFTAEGTINNLEPVERVLTIRFTSGAADPAKSEMVITPASPIVAGNSYTAKVTVRDANGNPVQDTVSFSLVPNTPAKLSASSCTTDGNGVCEVQIQSDLVTTTAVHATLSKNGVPTELGGNGDPAKASPQTVAWIPGPVCVVNCDPVDPTHITRVEVITDGQEANGMATDVAQVFAYDRLGNAVPDAVVDSTTTDSALQILKPIMSTGADGTGVIEYASTTKGAHIAKVTIDGKIPTRAISMVGPETTDGSITLNFGSGTANAAHSTLSIDPTTPQEVDSLFTVTAHVNDVNDNAVEGTTVVFPNVENLQFLTAAGQPITGTASCVSGSDGTCQVKVTSKLVGTYTISGTINSQPMANTVEAQFTHGPVCVEPVDVCNPVNPDNLSRVEVITDGVEANGQDRDVAKAWAYDRNGNPVPDTAVTSAQVAGETGLTVQSNIAPTGSDGTTTIYYTATQRGTYHADVTIGGKTPKESPIALHFGPGAGSLLTSRWVVTPAGPLIVGEDPENTYTATATIKDANGSTVPGAIVSFTIDPSGPVFNSTTCEANDSGVCSVQVHSTKSGTYVMTASIAAGVLINSTTNGPSASVVWSPDEVCSAAEDCYPVDPNLPDELRTEVVVTVDHQLADGVARDKADVRAFDKWGNAVEGARVASTTTDADLTIQTGIAPIGKDGHSTIWYTSTKAGTYHADVRVDEHIPTGSPVELHFDSTPPPPICIGELDPTCPHPSYVEVTKNDQPAGGGKDEVTAHAFYTTGEPAPDVTFTFVKSDAAGPLQIQPSCTTGADGTCKVTAESPEVGKFYAKASINGTELTENGSPLELRFGLCIPNRDAECTPGEGDVTRVEVTLNDQAAGGGEDVVTAYARTADKSPVAGSVFTFWKSDESGPLVIGASCTTGADGTCTVKATSAEVGKFYAKASVEDFELTAPPSSELELRFTTNTEVCIPGVDADCRTKVEVTTNDRPAGGGIDVVTATAYDKSDALKAGVTFTFVKSDPAGPLVIGASCVTGADGTCTVNATSAEVGKFYAKASVEGTELTAEAGSPLELRFGLCIPGRDPECEGSDNGTRIEVTTNDQPVGGGEDVVTAYARTADGTPVAGAEFSFVKSDPAGPLVIESSCTTAANGNCTVKATSNQLGKFYAKASVEGYELTAAAGSPAELRFGACIEEAGHTCVNASRAEVTLDNQPAGVSPDIVTGYAYDAKGDPLAGVVFTFAKKTSTDPLVIAPTCTTGSNGQCTVEATSPDPGTFDATASIGDVLLTNSPLSLTFRESAKPPTPCVEPVADECTASYVEVTTNDQAAGGGIDVVTAHAFDQNSAPMAGVIFTFAKKTATDPLVIAPSCTTGANGQCTVNATSPQVGSFKATASIGQVELVNNGSPVTLNFLPCMTEAGHECSPNPEQQTRIEVTTDNQIAGEAPDVVTAYAFDMTGLPLANVVFTFTKVNNADPMVVTPSCTTDVSGRCSVNADASNAGQFKVAAKVGSIALSEAHGSPATLTFLPRVCIVERGDICPATEKTRVEVSLNDQAVGKNDVITAHARDAQGNPVGDVPFTFVKATASDDVVVGASCTTTLPTGDCTVNATSATAGSHSVRGSIGTIELTQSGSPLDVRFLGRPVITSPEDGTVTNDDPLVITGTGQTPGNTITVKDDEGATICTAVIAANKTWTCSKSLPDGEYTLVAVESTPDGVGQSDPSDPVTVTIDKTKPAKPVITDPSDGDTVTDNTPPISGTGDEPGNEITVKDGDGNEVCTATVKPDKTWTCTPDEPLKEGENTLIATETDPAGNVSDPSDPVVITVDTLKPAKPVITDPSDGDIITDNTPVISGTGDEPGNKIEVKDGDKVICTTTVKADKTWACEATDPLVDGDHTFIATETDPAGNKSDPSDPVTVTLDTTKPAPPLVDPTNGSEVKGTSDPDTTVTVKDPDGAVIPGCEDVPVNPDGTWSCTPEKRPDPGTVLDVTAKDPAGNVSDPTKVTVRALRVEVAYPTRNHGEEQIVTGYNYNPGEEACLTVYSEALAVGCKTVGPDGTVTFSFTVPDSFAAGSHTVTVTGKVSGSQSASFQVTIPVPQVQVKTGGTAAGSMAPYGVLMALCMGSAGLWVATKRRTKA